MATRYLRHADGSESWTRTPEARRPAAPRPNRYAGPCGTCGENVPAGAGRLGDRVGGRWTVRHNVCPAVEAEEREFMARAKARAEADCAEAIARMQAAITAASSDPACGTTGCEAHDGECRDNWANF